MIILTIITAAASTTIMINLFCAKYTRMLDGELRMQSQASRLTSCIGCCTSNLRLTPRHLTNNDNLHQKQYSKKEDLA